MTSKVKVLYFASLREAVGTPGEELALPANVGTVGALREHLAARGDAWGAMAAGRNVRSAVNQRSERLPAVAKYGSVVAPAQR